MSEAGELKEELKTLKAEYQTCQSRYEEERTRLENDVSTLGEKLASLEKTSHAEREAKAKLEKELRKVQYYSWSFNLDSYVVWLSYFPSCYQTTVNEFISLFIFSAEWCGRRVPR